MPARPKPAALQAPARTPHSSRRAVKRATYTVNSRKRVLFTVSTDATSKLIDVPADLYVAAASGLPTPDTFIVEPQLHGDTQELEAILTEYLAQAALHKRVPMTFSRLGDFLQALAG